MKPWFIREGDVIKFPDPSAKKIVRLPTIDQYTSFIDGVTDLQAQLNNGQISKKIYDKLYTDLIHKFSKKEGMDPWFMREAPEDQGIMGLPQATAGKLDFIKSKLSKGEISDPKTIDFIYKILNKPQIKATIDTLVTRISQNDQDVANFRKLNQGVFSKLLRKLPVEQEALNVFLKGWAAGKSFVNTKQIKIGQRGTLEQLISDPTAYKAFEVFESIKSQYRMPKKGTTGYGEFGMAMLSPDVRLKAPGDIEINGEPVEVKGNDARLYADERAMSGAGESIGESVRGSAPGLITNIHANLQNKDAKIRKETVNSVANAFAGRGIDKNTIKSIIANAQKSGSDPFETIGTPWWKASFNYYQRAIKMPIMIVGFGQWLISDNADDFISWGCLPKSQSNYGYVFGRPAGQSRETFPKIFVPGHNK